MTAISTFTPIAIRPSQPRIPHSQLAHQHKHPKRGHWLALLIGLLHGAAGSGGLLVLVVAATHSIFEAFIYILVFAVGAIVGMALLSIVVSMPLSLAQAGAGPRQQDRPDRAGWLLFLDRWPIGVQQSDDTWAYQ